MRFQPTVRPRNVPVQLSFTAFAITVLLLLGLNGCASNRGNMESRIESKLNTPAKDHVQIGTATYNRFSRGFEEPWPFGPYSN